MLIVAVRSYLLLTALAFLWIGVNTFIDPAAALAPFATMSAGGAGTPRLMAIA